MTRADLHQLLDYLHHPTAPSVLTQLEEQLQAHLSAVEAKPELLLDTLFLKAIRDHVQPQAGSHEHLYLQRFEIPQIVLFDVLINRMPFVVMSHAITNRAMANALKTARNAVVMDIGIGRGIQIVRLLDELINTENRLQKLTIIGVEPFAEAVAFAETQIREIAEKAPFAVEFVSLVSLVEGLKPDALAQTLPTDYDRFVINSSLTVHHLPTVAQRQALFHQLRSLQPDLFLLTEPHSNHLEPDWRQRTQNAYEHYGAVFGVIDGLDIDVTAKNGLKLFFGREIDDVVGHPDDQRFERHQEAGQWIQYLQESGFRLVSEFDIPAHLPPSPIHLRTQPAGFLAMEYEGVNVLSIFQAVANSA